MSNKIYTASVSGTITNTKMVGGKWEVRLEGSTVTALYYLDTVVVAIGQKVASGDVIGYETVEAAGGSSSAGSVPIRVDSSGFLTSTRFRHTDLLGKRLLIFANHLGRYLTDSEWGFTEEGVNITLDGFDSVTQNVELIINTY